MEENNIVHEDNQPNVELGLEEIVIPHENNTTDDNELDDVIPFEPSSFDIPSVAEYNSLDYEETDLYNDSFTSNASVGEMFDIAPASVGNREEGLEEVIIPNENNTADDNQLDDIVVE